jgi:hypothetical protein
MSQGGFRAPTSGNGLPADPGSDHDYFDSLLVFQRQNEF